MNILSVATALPQAPRQGIWLPQIEPGDGTRYTALAAVNPIGNDIAGYMAFGSGEIIRGGYPVPAHIVFEHLRFIDWCMRHSHYVTNRRDAEQVAPEDKAPPTHQYGYWGGHAGISNDWSRVVALHVFTGIYIIQNQSVGQTDHDHFRLGEWIRVVGHIYREQWAQTDGIAVLRENDHAGLLSQVLD